MENPREFDDFLGKEVIVVTTARLTSSGTYNVGDSLQLFGTLKRESENYIFLSEIKSKQRVTHGVADILRDSQAGMIRKDKIVALCEA